MTSNFINCIFDNIFNSNTTSNAKRKRNRNRSCRIEELEGREMLSVTPWSMADDYYSADLADSLLPSAVCDLPSPTTPLAAATGDAHADDLAVYNNLIARGCQVTDFTWQNGRITELRVNNRGLGTLDVTKLTALRYLDCSGNGLTELDVTKNVALEFLNCGGYWEWEAEWWADEWWTDGVWEQYRGNSLTTLDVSKNTALTALWCAWNQLAELDVSKNTALTFLNCTSNQLTTLDASKNTALTGLYCQYNLLTALDVSKNTALISLQCYHNQLKSLNVSKNTALVDLNLWGNQLTELDVTNNLALDYFDCADNRLTKLDVSQNTALRYLRCWGNQLTGLDVAKNIALTELHCGWNQLSELNISNNTALKRLDCQFNHLTELDVSKITALKDLYCDNNQLTQLDVSKNTTLTALCCYGNHLTTLDISANLALEYLECGANQLSTLDVSKHTALGFLGCWNNQFTALDVSNNALLTYLNCEGNQLTNLNVSNLTRLERLFYSYNPLTERVDISTLTQLKALGHSGLPQFPLDFSALPNTLEELHYANNQLTSLDIAAHATLPELWYLNVNHNQLTALDMSALPKLKELHCADNQLVSLDVTKNLALTVLKCGDWFRDVIGFRGNNLTSLDVSNNTALTHLWCTGNQLTTLDVTNNTALTFLLCQYNRLETLDVSQNLALTLLHCHDNQLTVLDVSQNVALTSLRCDSNQLAELSLSNISGLTELTFGYNKLSLATLDYSMYDLTALGVGGYNLTELDVSQFTNLKELYCDGNRLTTLDICQHTALTRFSCHGNQLTELTLTGTPLDNYESATRTDNGTFYTYIYTSSDRILWVDKTVTLINSNTKTKLEAPTISDVLFLPDGEIIVTWSNIPNADSYVVEYAKVDTFSNKQTKTVTEEWVSLGILDHTTYYFRVLAIGSGIYTDSDYSPVVSALNVIQLTAPTLGTVTATSSSTISVSWSAVTNANGYVIQYATNAAFTAGVDTKTIDSQSTTSTIIEGLNPNTLYYVRVMATGTGGHRDSEWSGAKFAITDKAKLTAPEISYALAPGGGEIILTWYKVPNASSYVVQYATTDTFADAKNVPVAATWASLTEAALEGFNANATYYFRVIAIGTGDYINSDYSATVSTTTPAIRLNVPMITSAIAGADKVSVTWAKVLGASSYLVEYSTDDWATTESMVVNGNEVSAIIDSGMTPGKTCKVKVRATGTGEYTHSDFSNEQSATIPSVTPNPVRPKVKAERGQAKINSVTLTWAGVENVEYLITCNALPGWSMTVSGNEAFIEGLQHGKNYRFTITAQNADGTQAKAITMSAKTVRYAAVKKSRSTDISLDSVTLNWTDAKKFAETDGYAVYMIVGKGKSAKEVLVKEVDGTETSAVITGLQASTRYTFVVKAVASGMELESVGTKISVSTKRWNAVKMSKSDIGSTSVVLNWTYPKAPVGITYDYEVYQLVGKEEIPVTERGFTVAIEGMSATVGGLTTGQRYTFVIRAVVKDVDGNIVNKSLGTRVAVRPK